MAKKTKEYLAEWQYLATHDLKDVTSEIANIVNNVKKLQAEGKYGEAARYIEEYQIQDYIMSSNYVNAIDEKTRNLEIDYKERSQSIYYMDEEPNTDMEDDVWLAPPDLTE